jgi:Protein of unknown function (DUF2971)
MNDPWNFSTDAFQRTQEILQESITELVKKEALTTLPPTLYHYTSLETAERILNGDDIRLGHAEYSNDQQEMEEAKRVIHACLASHVATPAFLLQVQADYQARAGDLDAYIFCMSTGDPQRIQPQDLLSQWRAYGADGRGACITLDPGQFANFSYHLPGFRINPIIYDPGVQTLLVNDILDRGNALHLAGDPAAAEAAVAALVFATPLMKAEGFSEEREWRLIFMPPPSALPQPEYAFHPRRDFLAPYVRLHHLWHVLRPALAPHSLLPTPPYGKRTPPAANPLIPATGIMIGPSGHQALNGRSITKVLAQAGRSFSHTASAIPYRSLS